MLITGIVALKLLVTPLAEDRVIEQIAASGRCVTVAESPDKRVAKPHMVPPGKPPLLSFRYYESKARHGTTSSGLMLDDAGH